MSSGAVPTAGLTTLPARALAKSLGHSCPRTEHLPLAAVSPSCTARPLRSWSTPVRGPNQVRDRVTRLMLEQAPELAERRRGRWPRGRLMLRF